MLQKIHLISLVLALLIGFPLKSFAAGDSTKIGISVVIKATQHCDYALDHLQNISANSINESALLHCGMNSVKLQQYVEQANSLTDTSSSIEGDNRLRVYMVVQ